MLTPIGLGMGNFWRAIQCGEIGVAAISRFDSTEYPSRIAAQIDDFTPGDFMPDKRVHWTDRFSQFSVAASRMALEDANFHVNGNGSDVGVYIGSALGGLAYADEQSSAFSLNGLSAVRPLLAISVFGGASTCNVSIEFGLNGPNVANGNSCASGAVAIGEAFRAVSRGDVRSALAGGVEAPLAPLIYGAFTVIRAMSTRNDDPKAASRPFDRDRDGFVMAEGAGLLFLERYDDAVRRNAAIYGEVAGYGLSNDAHHMSAPRPDGTQTARAMQCALEEADVSASEVDAINAHGSSTTLGDRAEALAYARVFGKRSSEIPLTATKSQHGHALGATGAWEAGIALMSIRNGVIPKMRNIEHPDPQCQLRCTTEETKFPPRIILSNSSGFGGINAALVFKAAT